MKKLAITQFSILAFVSGVVTVLTFITGGLVANHWNEFLFGGSEEVILPAVTVFATQYGFWVPLVCCFSSIVCVAVSTKKYDNLPVLWAFFTLIVTVELIGLALIAWLNIFPALKIMYRFI